MTLARLWAGWRGEYIAKVEAGEVAQDGEACVFCRILGSGEPDDTTYVVWRDERVAVLLNAYPYTSGHVLVMPVRHVGDLEDLDAVESAAVWSVVTDAVRAVKAAYEPGGINLGANLGKAAGAGVPGHLHVHCLPRWNGDTNFVTTVAEARVLPEALRVTWEKLRAAWPAG
jgi:ATP adenylyltransferase